MCVCGGVGAEAHTGLLKWATGRSQWLELPVALSLPKD